MHVKGDTIKYAETRRGINATADILNGKTKIGTIYDEPEKIVATVVFVSEETRAEFLHQARRFGYQQTSEAYAISEFARQLLTDTESEYVKAH